MVLCPRSTLVYTFNTYIASGMASVHSDSHYFHITILMVTQMRKLNKFVSYPNKTKAAFRVTGVLVSSKIFIGWQLSGGLHAHLPQKDIEKKVNLTELSQNAKKII